MGIVPSVWSGLNYVGGPLSQEELGPWVQDALDQLQFLTGPVDTTFGALRASLGHPEPWLINYVEVGNEDNLMGGGESYVEYRLEMFYNAIKENYPNITVLASGSEYTMNLTIPDVGGDFHVYKTPDGYAGASSFGQFDDARHETLIGEMACVYPNNPNNTTPSYEDYAEYPFWICSVSEAVFLLGAERNSDRVIGATYAPILANMNGKQWTPTLLSFDADPKRTTLSTSHHTWGLLSSSPATQTLPSAADSDLGPLYYSTGRDNATGSLLFKAAVYNSTSDVPISISFEGVVQGSKSELTVLTADDPFASDVLGGPEVVKRSTQTLIADDGGAFKFSLPSLSVATLKV